MIEEFDITEIIGEETVQENKTSQAVLDAWNSPENTPLREMLGLTGNSEAELMATFGRVRKTLGEQLMMEYFLEKQRSAIRLQEATELARINHEYRLREKEIQHEQKMYLAEKRHQDNISLKNYSRLLESGKLDAAIENGIIKNTSSELEELREFKRQRLLEDYKNRTE